MSAARRLPPNDASRRGWCPSLARPMPTGDGLLARVHPPLGILTAAQLRAVAEAARLCGNGHVDITARGNLQIRGVSAETACALAAHLTEVGLGDVRSDGGPQRLTLTSPLAGHDPNALIDAVALARAVEAVGLTIAGLPAKTLVAIESGGWGIGGVEADVLVRPTALGRVAIGLASEVTYRWLQEVAVDQAPAAVGHVLTAFAVSGHRRMRDLNADAVARIAEDCAEPQRESPSPLCGGGWPLRQQGSGEGSALSGNGAPLSRPALRATLPRIGGRVDARLAGKPTALSEPGLAEFPAATALVIEAPFGRCNADGFELLAHIADSARGGLETSPSRCFAIIFSEPTEARAALDHLTAAGFITDPTDPRRAVAACPGAPACASGSTAVPEHAAHLAQAFAPFAARGLTAHVSGCAKGCAHPRSADLTLVAEDGRYRVVLDGAPSDPALASHLTFEAALDRVRRADPARCLAGAFPS